MTKHDRKWERERKRKTGKEKNKTRYTEREWRSWNMRDRKMATNFRRVMIFNSRFEEEEEYNIDSLIRNSKKGTNGSCFFLKKQTKKTLISQLVMSYGCCSCAVFHPVLRQVESSGPTCKWPCALFWQRVCCTIHFFFVGQSVSPVRERSVRWRRSQHRFCRSGKPYRTDCHYYLASPLSWPFCWWPLWQQRRDVDRDENVSIPLWAPRRVHLSSGKSNLV